MFVSGDSGQRRACPKGPLDRGNDGARPIGPRLGARRDRNSGAHGQARDFGDNSRSLVLLRCPFRYGAVSRSMRRARSHRRGYVTGLFAALCHDVLRRPRHHPPLVWPNVGEAPRHAS